MTLAEMYSTSLTNGSFIVNSSDFDRSSKALEFAKDWERLRLIYFKGAFHSVAAKAASNVVISEAMLDVDDLILEDSGSILTTIMAKQAAMKPNRFNRSRCSNMFNEDIDF